MKPHLNQKLHDNVALTVRERDVCMYTYCGSRRWCLRYTYAECHW